MGKIIKRFNKWIPIDITDNELKRLELIIKLYDIAKREKDYAMEEKVKKWIISYLTERPTGIILK